MYVCIDQNLKSKLKASKGWLGQYFESSSLENDFKLNTVYCLQIIYVYIFI